LSVSKAGVTYAVQSHAGGETVSEIHVGHRRVGQRSKVRERGAVQIENVHGAGALGRGGGDELALVRHQQARTVGSERHRTGMIPDIKSLDQTAGADVKKSYPTDRILPIGRNQAGRDRADRPPRW